MGANYLERIVVAGSRRGATVRPAAIGPPTMPGLLQPSWLFPAEILPTEDTALSGRGIFPTPGSTVVRSPASPPQRAEAAPRLIATPAEPPVESVDPAAGPAAEASTPLPAAPSLLPRTGGGDRQGD